LIRYSLIYISKNWFNHHLFIYLYFLFYPSPLHLTLLTPQPWPRRGVIHGSTYAVKSPWGWKGSEEPLSGSRAKPL